MSEKKYVVIGSSAAGVNAVRELRRLDPSSHITLISKDEDIYSRCILHEYLSGKRDKERLHFVEKDFEKLYDVDWKKGVEATGLDRAKKEVLLSSGANVPYDKLLIATGSGTAFPPIQGLAGAKNMVGFRNIGDIEILKQVAKERKNIVILGTGLVGVDCAIGFIDLGVKVCVIDLAPWPLVNQLDEKAAAAYIKAFEAHGVSQYYGASVREVIQNEKQEITRIILDDDEEIPCDYLIVATGVRANIDFLQDSGLEMTKKGLVYDESGQTSDPDIYGAGDVSGLSPIWPVAVKEGMIAASNMAGQPMKKEDFFASKSTMRILDINTMSLGIVNPDPQDQELRTEVFEAPGVYKKVVHRDGKIVGALLQGDLAYGGVLQQMIARGIDVRKVRKPLFEIDYSDFFNIREGDYEFFYTA